LGPATTALFTAAVPCVTTVAAIPLLAEHPSPTGMLGVAAVTFGMVVSLRAGRRVEAQKKRPGEKPGLVVKRR
jgi:drug/metabolite transporter (DMT)-like permease